MTAVLKHELRNYFHSLTAYVFGAFLLAFVGIGAMLYNIQAAVSNFEFVLSFGCLVFVFIVPILTMRVIAEERKQRTDQLLYALPITTTQVIIGKYLALLAVYLIPMCLICLYPLIFSQYGDVYLLTSYGSILAFFIMGAALIALGVFISSLTDNQGFAAGIGIAVILLNYYSVSLSEFVSGVKYYQGNRSPQAKEREELGYSAAWLHHKGRNKHHFEYWTDFADGERVFVEMPARYLAEMICDRVAASKVYLKDKYTDESPLQYFLNKTDRAGMNEKTAEKLEYFLTMLKDEGEKYTFKQLKKYVKENPRK